MLDNANRFFYNTCPNGHVWEIYGDVHINTTHIYGKRVLVFTYASLFDSKCPQQQCGEAGSTKIPNVDNLDVYCFCPCVRCKKHTYALMMRDVERESRLETSLGQKRYRLSYVPMFCQSCRDKMVEEENRETVS